MKMAKSNVLYYLALIALFFFSFLVDDKIRNLLESFRFPWLDFIFGVITNFGIVMMVMLIIPLLMLSDKKKIYTMLLAFFSAALISIIVKWMFLRQRPDNVAHLFASVLKYSFPSMHAAVVFSLLPMLLEFLPKQKNFWIAFALLVPLTRLYFGFHYLSDVVFGALLGCSLGSLLLDLHKKGSLWKA